MSQNNTGKSKPRALWLFLALLGLAVIITLAVWLGRQVGQSNRQALAPTSTPSPDFSVSQFDYKYPPSPAATSQTGSEQARLLALADKMLSGGQYVEAAAEYRLVLQNYPKTPEAVSAQLGLGKAETGRGRYKEAANAFQQFMTAYPNDPRKRLAIYGLAEAQADQGQWEQAIASYQAYLQDPQGQVIEGYVRYNLGAAYLAANKPTEALENFQKAADLKDGGSNLLQAMALEHVGDYYSGQGNAAEAVKAYNRILEFAKVSSYRAGIALKIGSAYDKAKQPEQANQAYRAVVDGYFGTDASNQALQILIDRDAGGIDDYLRGYNAFQKGNYNDAVNILDRVLGRPAPGQAIPPFAPDLPAAQQERLAQAWLWEGTAIELLNFPDRATREYRELADRLTNTPSGQEALWKLASLFRKQDKLPEAAATFGELATKYPNGSHTEDALVNQFSLLLQQNGPEQADKTGNALYTKFDREDALFKLALAYSLKGNNTAARPLYQKLADRKSDSYYSVRSVEILAGADPLKAQSSVPQSHPAVYNAQRFQSDYQRDKKELEDSLLSWAAKPAKPSGTPGATPATPVPTGQTQLVEALKTVRSDAGVRRLVELTQLGMNDRANREGQEAVTRFAGKPLEMYWLALVLNENGQYYHSISAAKELFNLYQQANPGKGLRAAPLLLQKLIYPLDFQDMVLEQSQRFEIDPLLLLSLIKQESAFDPDANSGAGAIGLTQVMPDTGKGIANALGKSEFSSQDLFQPHTAIEFGAFYLQRQLESFKGNPYAALAAYNGGAGNVGEWLGDNPPERNFDQFVEGISFPETRTYVKILYTNYAMYREIYKG